MGVNLDKPGLWKADVARSVDFYNAWFMKCAPEAYRATRVTTTKEVEEALRSTSNLVNISPILLRRATGYPNAAHVLRPSHSPRPPNRTGQGFR